MSSSTFSLHCWRGVRRVQPAGYILRGRERCSSFDRESSAARPRREFLRRTAGAGRRRALHLPHSASDLTIWHTRPGAAFWHTRPGAENSYGAQRGQAGGRGKFKFKFKFNPASMGLRLNWSLSLSLAALNLNLNVNFSRQTLRSAVATPAHAHTERLKNGFTERLKNALKTLYRTH